MKKNKPPLFPDSDVTNNKESTPLVSALTPSLPFQYTMETNEIGDYDTDNEEDNNNTNLNKRLSIDKNDDDDDDDDDDKSTLSVFSHAAFPWAFQDVSSRIIPSNREIVVESEDSSDEEDIDDDDNDDSVKREDISNESPLKNLNHHHKRKRLIYLRSLRRIFFLVLTEPQSSIASAVFFIFLITMIALSNILMMMQTCTKWSFTPKSCFYCSSSTDDDLADDNVEERFYDQSYDDLINNDVECICPPMPLPTLVFMEDAVIAFFAIEWTLRVLCYEPPPGKLSKKKRFYSTSIIFFQEWISFLLLPSTIIDALAIFPYYLEEINQINGFLSLRLLRLFRVFQLLRLGQYNVTFITLRNVLYKSMLCLNILMIVFIFGAAFFGSIIFWLEKGKWQYTTFTDPPSFMYMRFAADGVTQEPSPFTSIPAAFWWFIVTATTVGYGDVFPTSLAGKFVGTLAMLTGVLVIAFPVSVFSDLWSKELKKVGIFDLDDNDDDIYSQKSGFDYDPRQSKHLQSLSKLHPHGNSETKHIATPYEAITTEDSTTQNNSLKLPSTFLGFGDPREFSKTEFSSSNVEMKTNSPNGKKRLHRRCNSDIIPTIQNRNTDIDDTTITHHVWNTQGPLHSGTTNNLLGLDFLENSPLQKQQRKTTASFNNVILSSNDMDILQRHLASIDESQKVIHRILSERSHNGTTSHFNKEHHNLMNGCEDKSSLLST